MNRFIAILLLSIQLYTLGGYTALRQYMVHRSDNFFNAQAARGQHCTSDLFEVRIPVDLPGVNDWANYEHISGQIQFRHSTYNYVQLRVTSRVLYLKCIPNYRATRHINQNVLSASPIRDIPVPKKEHVPDAGILLVSGLPARLAFTTPPVAITAYTTLQTAVYHQPVVSRTIETLKQPPRLIV